jgi:hypothetical protein
MQIVPKNYKLLALILACLCFASIASAEIIVSRPGGPQGNQNQLGGLDDNGLSEYALAVSWNQTIGFQNVIIDVYNLRNLDPAANMTVNFFLRSTLLGANDFTGDVTVLADATSDGQPFNSLTLGPGTYYLIASASNFNGAWLGLEGLEETHPQASFGTEYLRDPENPLFTDIYSPLGLGYQVSGDAVTNGEIPEPGTWLLLGTGLLTLAGVLRRRRRS